MQSAEGLMNIIANPQSFLNNIRDRVRSVMDAGKYSWNEKESEIKRDYLTKSMGTQSDDA